jgi:hypothetical protein
LVNQVNQPGVVSFMLRRSSLSLKSLAPMMLMSAILVTVPSSMSKRSDTRFLSSGVMVVLIVAP